MRIGLLGELEVLGDDENDVAISGAKLRALLALLALHVAPSRSKMTTRRWPSRWAGTASRARPSRQTSALASAAIIESATAGSSCSARQRDPSVSAAQ